MNCRAHPGREASDFCLDCQAALCLACTRPLSGGAYCAPCFAARYRRRSLIRHIALAVTVIGLGVGGFLLYESKKHENRERERYGAHREQVESLRASFDEDVCNVGTALELAEVLEDTQNMTEAREVLERSSGNCPRSAAVLQRLCEIHRQLGQTVEAIAVAESIIELTPRRARGYALRAELREHLGLGDGAMSDYSQAFELDPTDEETAERLSSLLEQRGEKCASADIIDELLGRGNPREPARFRERSDRLRRAGSCLRERVEGGRVIVPFEKQHDVMMVTVRLNDSVDARMLLDTGASSLALSRPLANRLSIDTSEARSFLVSTAGGVTRAHRVMLDSVALGGARVRMVRAAVVDSLSLDDAEGLLGNSFLSRFDVTVDAASGQVVLQERK